jgi:AAA+ superfamily predicted ATPase
LERSLGPELAWQDCDVLARAELLRDLKSRAPLAFGAATIVGARELRPPFYAHHVLYDVTLDGVAGVERALLLRGPGAAHWLDGTSAAIHAVNEAERIQLTAATVAAYVRFFLYVLRGGQGAFTLIESPDEIVVGTAPGSVQRVDDTTVAARLATARSRWQPLTLGTPDPDGRFRLEATVAYGGGLYGASYAVKPNGEIEMIEDAPLAELDGLDVPVVPALVPEPVDARPTREQKAKRFQEILETAQAQAATPAAEAAPGPDDRHATEAVVSVMLSEAARASLGHTLLQRFNTQSQAAGPLGQLTRFVHDFSPIVIIESEIPFVEDIVVGLLDPDRKTFPPASTERASAVSGDDSRCYVDLRDSTTKLHLISFHAYRSLWDAEWAAHQLAIGEAAVLIGCERRADVPEPLRRVADLVLTMPRFDEKLFAQIFRHVLHSSPPAGWRKGGGDWVRYLLHSDFHAPLRLKLSAVDAVMYLRERVQARLAAVSADNSPALKDLHGLGEARQVADDLIADIAAARAGRIPWSAVDRGLLLVGAPGTGKTTLAKAIARACEIKFVHASAAQWQSAGGLDMHLRAIRQTFAEARRYAPAILFIDEIDSIGNRESFAGSNGIYQTEVVNGLLEQIQGMDEDEPVIVIGATNFLERVDPALRRAGRLDQVVNVPRPNIAGLEQIFRFHLSAYRASGQVHRDVNVKALARLAFGLTGADVEFFVRGAARRARKLAAKMTQADLVAEITRRPRRPDSVVQLSVEDMQRVAVHESGHALAALKSDTGAREVTYVSIIPRMDGSLGFTASTPPQGAVMTRPEVLDRLRTILAGRAAEEVVYGKEFVSLSAGGGESSDLAVATRIATSVVCTSGFGGDRSLQWTPQPTAAQTAQIGTLLSAAYRAAIRLLKSERAALDRIAAALVEKQELDGAAVRRLVASRKAAGNGRLRVAAQERAADR